MIELNTSRYRKLNLDDRIIPMINVIFLLLLFFLIAGSMTELVREDIQPPRSESAAIRAGGEAEWLLSASGELLVGERRLDTERLLSLLESGEIPLPQELRLRADARTQARILLPLMELLRDHGVQRIALVAIGERGES